MESSISSRLRIPEIARRLNIARDTVYAMLEARQLPGIRIGRRWLVTKQAYENWEKNCGARPPAPEFRTALA